MNVARYARKPVDAVGHLKRRRDFRRGVVIDQREELLHLGTRYGGWSVPRTGLDASSTCYLCGIGTDITFDLHLIARFGPTVHAFDPVPASQEYAASATACEPRYVLHRFGIWSRDEVLRFHAPVATGHISHSATNIKQTHVAFEAPVRAVRSVMDELGHDRLDLLKLSVEGSEFEIVEHVVSENVPIRLLCVEFAQPAPLDRMEASTRLLAGAGFRLAHADIAKGGWKLLFVSDRLPP